MVKFSVYLNRHVFVMFTHAQGNLHLQVWCMSKDTCLHAAAKMGSLLLCLTRYIVDCSTLSTLLPNLSPCVHRITCNLAVLHLGHSVLLCPSFIPKHPECTHRLTRKLVGLYRGHSVFLCPRLYKPAKVRAQNKMLPCGFVSSDIVS